MINSSFLNYSNYFKDFCSADAELEFFLFGGITQGMDYAKGQKDFKYPFMWLEEPLILSSSNGSQLWDDYSGGVLFVTEHRQKDGMDHKIASLDAAFKMMGRFEKKLREDAQTLEEGDGMLTFLEISDKMEKGVIDPIFLMDAIGWRLEFEFKMNSNNYLHDGDS